MKLKQFTTIGTDKEGHTPPSRTTKSSHAPASPASTAPPRARLRAGLNRSHQ